MWCVLLRLLCVARLIFVDSSFLISQGFERYSCIETITEHSGSLPEAFATGDSRFSVSFFLMAVGQERLSRTQNAFQSFNHNSLIARRPQQTVKESISNSPSNEKLVFEVLGFKPDPMHSLYFFFDYSHFDLAKLCWCTLPLLLYIVCSE